MGYKAEHYNEILKTVQERYQIKNDDLPPRIWIAWRVSIKKMFDEGLLIREILSALPEAEDKKKWPLDTAFWHRVRDVAFKNRRETKPTMKINEIRSIREIMVSRGLIK